MLFATSFISVIFMSRVAIDRTERTDRHDRNKAKHVLAFTGIMAAIGSGTLNEGCMDRPVAVINIPTGSAASVGRRGTVAVRGRSLPLLDLTDSLSAAITQAQDPAYQLSDQPELPRYVVSSQSVVINPGASQVGITLYATGAVEFGAGRRNRVTVVRYRSTEDPLVLDQELSGGQPVAGVALALSIFDVPDQPDTTVYRVSGVLRNDRGEPIGLIPGSSPRQYVGLNCDITVSLENGLLRYNVGRVETAVLRERD